MHGDARDDVMRAGMARRVAETLLDDTQHLEARECADPVQLASELHPCAGVPADRATKRLAERFASIRRSHVAHDRPELVREEAGQMLDAREAWSQRLRRAPRDRRGFERDHADQFRATVVKLARDPL